MELRKEAKIQKDKFKVKLTPSDLPEGEKEQHLFEVLDMLLAPYPQQKQKLKSKLDPPEK